MDLYTPKRLRYCEVVCALYNLHRLINVRHDCSTDSELTPLSGRVMDDALEK